MRWEIPVGCSINSCLSNPVYFPRSQLSFHSQSFQVDRNKLQSSISLKDFNQKVLVCYSNVYAQNGVRSLRFSVTEPPHSSYSTNIWDALTACLNGMPSSTVPLQEAMMRIDTSVKINDLFEDRA